MLEASPGCYPDSPATAPPAWRKIIIQRFPRSTGGFGLGGGRQHILLEQGMIN